MGVPLVKQFGSIHRSAPWPDHRLEKRVAPGTEPRASLFFEAWFVIGAYQKQSRGSAIEKW